MAEEFQTNPEGPPVEAPVESSPDNGKQYVVARYGRMFNIGRFQHYLDARPVPGQRVVLRTDRGAELGEVLSAVGEGCGGCIAQDTLDDYIGQCGQDYPFGRHGKVLRLATPQDLNDQQHLDRSAGEEAAFCAEQIRQLGLHMKIVAVEHLLGGERIVFYFTSEHRVDFRELVRRMAAEYHTRIEMRQVGARDEARLVGDYERCGRRCCCQEFLKFLKPVSMRMAKVQKATLDPAKISGRCGRLMCCLRYEDSTYQDLQAALPRKGSWVRTAEGVVGKVVDLQILTQLVLLILPDRKQAVVANDEIVERNLPEPSAEELARLAAMPARKKAPPAPAVKEPSERPRVEIPAGLEEALGEGAEAETEAKAEAKAAPAKARRKRRRGRKQQVKPSHPEALSVPPKTVAAVGNGRSAQPRDQASAGEGAKKSTRKKRRRRKKGGKGTGGQGSPK